MTQNEQIFIQDQIGYSFNDPDLLQQAFTRRSYSQENGGEDNEVLEFIGDKVLDFFVVKLLIVQNSNSSELYEKFNLKNTMVHSIFESSEKNFPDENTFISNRTEAELTETKKLLTQKKTLASRIDELGIADYLLMGNGDIQQNANEQSSVKEDLFEAILGAVAIDSNWDMNALQDTVGLMLAPEIVLAEDNDEDYVSLIQEWSYCKTGGIPLYHFDKRNYTSTWYVPFDGISQRMNNIHEYSKIQYHCLLKIADNIPIFRGFGQSKTEARKNVCKLAYDYLCQEDLWLTLRDEIEDPNKDDAINQLEILARRGYFSVPAYEFKQTYDKDGNPIWKSTCCIAEESECFSAESSSKKDAKKSAAYEMLQYLLDD